MTTDDFERARERLAANVAAVRQKNGMSQQQLADAAGLDLKHVQKVEYGQLNPTLRTLSSLAVALGVSTGDLVDTIRARLPKRQVGRPRRTGKVNTEK